MYQEPLGDVGRCLAAAAERLERLARCGAVWMIGQNGGALGVYRGIVKMGWKGVIFKIQVNRFSCPKLHRLILPKEHFTDKEICNFYIQDDYLTGSDGLRHSFGGRFQRFIIEWALLTIIPLLSSDWTPTEAVNRRID